MAHDFTEDVFGLGFLVQVDIHFQFDAGFHSGFFKTEPKAGCADIRYREIFVQSGDVHLKAFDGDTQGIAFLDCSSSPLREMLKPSDFSSMGSAEIFCDFFRFLLLPFRLKNIPLEGASFLVFFLTLFFFDPALAVFAFPISLRDFLPLVDVFVGFFEAAVFLGNVFFVCLFLFWLFFAGIGEEVSEKIEKAHDAPLDECLNNNKRLENMQNCCF